MTLLKLLKAYEEVLQREGLSPNDDVHLYSFLLQLSLGSESDWWVRFEKQCDLNARYGCTGSCLDFDFDKHSALPLEVNRIRIQASFGVPVI